MKQSTQPSRVRRRDRRQRQRDQQDDIWTKREGQRLGDRLWLGAHVRGRVVVTLRHDLDEEIHQVHAVPGEDWLTHTDLYSVRMYMRKTASRMQDSPHLVVVGVCEENYKLQTRLMTTNS